MDERRIYPLVCSWGRSERGVCLDLCGLGSTGKLLKPKMPQFEFPLGCVNLNEAA